MRISDWSSDVCSSDLLDPHDQQLPRVQPRPRILHRFRLDAAAPLASGGVDGDIVELIHRLSTRRRPRPGARCELLPRPWFARCAPAPETGRADDSTPVTNAHLVCCHLLETKKNTHHTVHNIMST